MNLPESYRPYTDKYFIRTRTILEKEGLNPTVSMVVFARGSGKIAGIADAIKVLSKYCEGDFEVFCRNSEEFHDMEPLMVIKAKVQSIVELETMYLGILSDALSKANGFASPDLKDVENKMSRLKSIFKDVPITYFGARHYLWSLDKDIAGAALRGGAVATSTDIGSSNIGEIGVGTIPHVLPLVFAHEYGRESATLKAADAFDKHIEIDVPRVILVDTFNREISDAVAVAQHFKGDCMVRIDTCSECKGEGCKEGKGVTVELVHRVRDALDDNGFEDTGIFLSGGFGDEEKAKRFMKARESCQSLFSGVGIGEVAPGIICTSDIYEIEGLPMSKAGRSHKVDMSSMRKIS